ARRGGSERANGSDPLPKSGLKRRPTEREIECTMVFKDEVEVRGQASRPKPDHRCRAACAVPMWYLDKKIQPSSLVNCLKNLAPREWTRTIDRTGNNRLLYQLSYRGMRSGTLPVFPKKLNIFRVLGLSKP